MYKLDLLTGEKFIPQRKTQKFATHANRIKYYNKKASKENEERAYADVPLKKNRKILQEVMGNETMQIINKNFLLGKGFVFGLFNHYEENLPCVYEFSIDYKIGNDNLTIKKL
ncbi:MAG: hypothetical protein V4548_12230 [Bacteroidota bacterium]